MCFLVLCRNTKFISELRAFFSSRPQLVELQRTGIVKQRVFGCDLGEHLLNSSRDGTYIQRELCGTYMCEVLFLDS